MVPRDPALRRIRQASDWQDCVPRRQQSAHTPAAIPTRLRPAIAAKERAPDEEQTECTTLHRHQNPTQHYRHDSRPPQSLMWRRDDRLIDRRNVCRHHAQHRRSATPSSAPSATRPWCESTASRRTCRGHVLAKVETFNPGQLDQGPDGGEDDRGRRAQTACSSPAARSSKARRATPAWAWRSPRS